MHILTPHHIKTHSLSFHTQIGFTILHALLDLSFETRNFDRPRQKKKKKKKNQKKLKMQLQVNLVVQVGQNSPHYKISNHSNISFDKEKYQTKKEK